MTQLPMIMSKNDMNEIFLDPWDRKVNNDERDRRYKISEEGIQVRLIGKYAQVDVRRIQKSPPVYRGHVAVEFDDGYGVMLYPTWHPLAIRPADEIAKYENKKVIVISKVFPKAPQPPDFSASLTGSCTLTMDSIELVP